MDDLIGRLIEARRRQEKKDKGWIRERFDWPTRKVKQPRRGAAQKAQTCLVCSYDKEFIEYDWTDARAYFNLVDYDETTISLILQRIDDPDRQMLLCLTPDEADRLLDLLGYAFKEAKKMAKEAAKAKGRPTSSRPS
jgi:hypothetical protein